MTELKILAISGSLRDGSYNTALLHAARKLNPGGMTIELYRGIGDLPLYRQDLDTASPPEPVADLRRRVAEADGLLIATPEHNASVPAALKNAIDWASRPAAESPLPGKPIAIAGASPGAFGSVRAQQALRQILASIGADVVVKPEVTVFRSHERFDGEGTLTDDFTASLLAELLTALAGTIRPFTR
ncbi:NAD(P)H-dependent oxidoreductase [Amycolatopsis roodepoortensis]|uniref:NADPH-dependent FMN reductase n=1 Tax=Amycolatopsis roodepoortensis TaxID=700274 RepID=UPI00214B5255|nr:NADPH-dependent FMN reductase [Amycolatopsis roodepoortensis]UUV34819.1 NAD(P)H-dependent oxidoreductase [Amycolatopsis roodepoortensis]